MTTKRWLYLAASVVAILAILVAIAAWRSMPGRALSADEIRERSAAEMNRIEARIAELERNASAAD